MNFKAVCRKAIEGDRVIHESISLPVDIFMLQAGDTGNKVIRFMREGRV